LLGLATIGETQGKEKLSFEIAAYYGLWIVCKFGFRSIVCVILSPSR